MSYMLVTPFAKQSETLRRLRDAVEQTKAMYIGARQQSDLYSAPGPHSGAAFRHAIHLEMTLLLNYRKAILEVNRFILRAGRAVEQHDGKRKRRVSRGPRKHDS